MTESRNYVPVALAFWPVIAIALALVTLPDAAAESEEAAIRRVVEDVYVRVVYQRGEVDRLAKGLDPEFQMLVRQDDGVHRRGLEEWIERIRKSRARTGDAPRPQYTHRFAMVDVTGPMAMVKLELMRDGAHRYTDYLTLYRFDEGWRIVTKVFTQHE